MIFTDARKRRLDSGKVKLTVVRQNRRMRTVLLGVLMCLSRPCLADYEVARPALRPDAQLCRAAIYHAERLAFLPPQLLMAIGRVESGRRDSASGDFGPWPWTVNAEGEGFFYDTKAQAIAAVREMRARGVRSIDVGCMQVNLMHHLEAFASLEAAFDPVTNAEYAARFLRQLQSQTGSWTRATAMYHSANPELGADYQRKVAAALPEERRLTEHGGASVPAAAPGVYLPPRWARNAQILPLAEGAAAGRGLAAYRLAPIAMISRNRVY